MAFHNSKGDMQSARRHAQANADYFQVPFVIFTDTCGNIHIERQAIGPRNIDVEVIQPHGEKKCSEAT